MRAAAWIVLAALAAALAFGVWRLRTRWRERRRAASAREAEFMAGLAPRAAASPSAPAAQRKDASGLPQQKLLFEAASKAAEAGEPALSIQLYARLLARFPESGFAGEARAAAEVQKKRLAAKT